MEKLLVCLVAGLGAGLGTGLAGMSAAAVISPMLIIFLNIPAYEAIGIALASVLIFTYIGSIISAGVENNTMGSFSVFMTTLMGIKFILKPVMTTKEMMEDKSVMVKMIQSIICGSLIGFICGFIGAGGGMMMLMILTSVLGYELKTAVGTSVFIMTFTALTGAISHFNIDGMPEVDILIMCIIFTLIFARLAARFANFASPKTLNRAMGIVLTVLGVIMLIVKFI